MARQLVTGVADVDRALREMGPKLGNRIYKKSLRKAGKKVAEQAKANLAGNIDTGELRKGIKVRAFRGKAKATGETKTLSSGRVVNIKASAVGVQVMTTEDPKDKPRDGGPAYGGAQLEFGRKHRAPYPADPFLRPALFNNEAAIRSFVIADVRDEIRATRANSIK